MVNQEGLIRYVSDRYNVSRSSLMDHLSAYRCLVVGLQVPWSAAFQAISEHRGALRRLNDVAEFDRDGNITNINMERARALPGGDGWVERLDELEVANGNGAGVQSAVREQLGKLVEDAEGMDIREAAKFFDETMGRSTVSFRRSDDGAFGATYTERSVSPDGEIETKPPRKIAWTPDKKVPEWVQEKLYRRLNAIDRE